MSLLSNRINITIGLVGIVLLVSICANVLGLVPSEDKVRQTARARLCEATAVSASMLIRRNDYESLRRLVIQVSERCDEIQSIGLRNSDDRLIVQSQNHDTFWNRPAESKWSRQVIPLKSGNGSINWGDLEFTFVALKPAQTGLISQLSPNARLMSFVAAMCGVLFMIYLGAMLSQLTPSKSVPTQVRGALDTLTEGLLVLNIHGDIALANKVFLGDTHSELDQIINRNPQDVFQWRDADGKLATEFPWNVSAESGEHVMGRIMTLRVPGGASESGRVPKMTR